MSNTNAGGGLSFVARLDTEKFKRDKAELEKMLADLRISTSKTSTEAEKAAKAAANAKAEEKKVSLQIQDALKAERLAIQEANRARAEANAQIAEMKRAQLEKNIADKEALALQKQLNAQARAKKPVISDSAAEVAAYQKSVDANKEITSTLNDQNIERAKQANAATAATVATEIDTKATKENALTKKEMARILAEEKFIQQQSTAELKNHAREMLNAKGSLEQRRAALIRLTRTYDQLSVAERNSAAGQRLKSIVVGVNEQVLQLEKDTLRAQRNVGNYGSALSKAWGGLKTLANILPGVGIAGLLAFAVDPLINYIGQLDIFKKKTNAAQEAQEAIAGVMGGVGQESAKATLQIAEMSQKFEQARNGVISKSDALKAYNEGIGKTLGFTDNLNVAEERTIKNGDAYIELMFRKAKAAAMMKLYTEEMSKAAEELAKTDEQSVSYILSNTKDRLTNAQGQDMYAANAERNRLAAAKPFQQRAEQFKKLWMDSNDDIAQFANKNGLNIEEATKGSIKPADAALNAQRSLQAKIDELTKRGVDKQLSADEQEVESVKQKYAKLREEAIRFNNDPTNKRRGLKVDGSGLVQAEDTETTAIRAKQATASLKTELDARKDLYAEYEDYRAKFGEQKADEQFAERLKGERSYLDQLKRMEEEILNPQQSKGADFDGQDLSAIDQSKLKEIQDRIKKTEDLEKQSMNDILASLQNYEKKRFLIQERYARERAKLTDESDIDASRFREKEELDALDDANVQKLDAYKALYEGVDHLSDAAAKKVIADAESMLQGLVEAGKISKELAKEIGVRLVDASDALVDRMPVRLNDLAQSLGNVASRVSDIDEGFGNMIGTLSNVIGSISSIKTIMNDIKKAQESGGFKGGALGQLSSGIGIAGAVIGAFSGIMRLVDSVSERTRIQNEYTYQLQIKQTEAVTKALERQVAAAQEAYGLERLEKYNQSLKSINEAIADQTDQLSGRYKLTGMKWMDDYITKLNAGLNPKKPTADADKFLVQLQYDTLEELQQLVESGVLDDATASLAQQLISNTKLYKETLNALKAETTGTTFNEIADSIVSMFENGTTAAEDFGKNFEEIMKKSVLNSFKRNYLANALQGFYDEFAEFSGSNGQLTESEISKLREMYDGIMKNASDKFKDLEKVAGVSFADSTSNSDMQGNRLTTASQESVNVLNGQLGGMRLAQLQTNNILTGIGKSIGDLFLLARDNFNTMLQIEANTKRTANNTDRLENIEGQLVAMNRKMDARSNAQTAAGL